MDISDSDDERRPAKSVYSEFSFGSRSEGTVRSLRSATANKQRLRFDPKTHSAIHECENSENDEEQEDEAPKNKRKRKSKNSVPSKVIPSKPTARSRKLERDAGMPAKQKRNTRASSSVMFESTPSSSQQPRHQYPSGRLTEANLSMMSASLESLSPAILTQNNNVVAEYSDGYSDIEEHQEQQDANNIKIDSNQHEFWWNGSKRHHEHVRVHIGRRIIIDGRILQYYHDIPQTVQVLEFKEKNSERVKSKSIEDIIRYKPESGVTHLYYIEAFKLPSSMPEGVVYLGHVLTIDSKPLLYQQYLKKKIDFDKYSVSDHYLLFCEKCFDDNDKSQLIYSGSGKRGTSDIKSHFASIHHVVSEAPRSKNKIVHVKKVNDEYVPVDIIKFDSNSEVNAMSIAYMLKMIVDNNLPMAVVDSWSFRESYLFLEPKLNIPGRKTMAGLLKATVDNQFRPMLESELSNVKYMSMVLDAWSNRRRQGILAIRVCYFGPNLQWKVKTISIKRVNGRHTAENLGDMIYEEMSKWKIIGKVKHITTDAGANVKAAVRDVKDLGPITDADIEKFRADKIKNAAATNGTSANQTAADDETAGDSADGEVEANEESILMEEEEDGEVEDEDEEAVDPLVEKLLNVQNDDRLIHGPALAVDEETEEEIKYDGEDSCTWINCIAHCTQTILSKLEKDYPAIKEVKERNSHIGRFCMREQVAAHIKKETNISFLKAGKTRWSSNVSSAATLLTKKMVPAVNFMIEEEKKLKPSDALIPDIISDEEFDRLHEFVLLLRPLTVLTDRMQKDGIVSPHAIPDILECYLDVAAIKGLKHFQEIQPKILQFMEEKHTQFLQDKDLILATFLDPVCKLDFFKQFDSGYAEVTIKNLDRDVPEGKTFISLEKLNIPKSKDVEALARQHLISNAERIKSAEGRLTRFEDPSTTLTSSSSKYNKLRTNIMTGNRNPLLNAVWQTDLDLYLQMTVNIETDLIAFWGSKYSQLPYLSRFVEFFFIKMPSSGSVERLFSILANIDLPDRCSSSDQTLENRMLYKENMNIIKRVREPKVPPTEVETLEAKVLASIRKIRVAKVK